MHLLPEELWEQGYVYKVGQLTLYLLWAPINKNQYPESEEMMLLTAQTSVKRHLLSPRSWSSWHWVKMTAGRTHLRLPLPMPGSRFWTQLTPPQTQWHIRYLSLLWYWSSSAVSKKTRHAVTTQFSIIKIWSNTCNWIQILRLYVYLWCHLLDE